MGHLPEFVCRVRFLVGCMIDVASGKITRDQAVDVLNRGPYFLQQKPFQCASSYGLYLYDVKHQNKDLDFDVDQWRREVEYLSANCVVIESESVEIVREISGNSMAH